MNSLAEKSSTKPNIVGPLIFSSKNDVSMKERLFPTMKEILCLFCDIKFKFDIEKYRYLEHLYVKHRLIIGDEEQIAIFHEYLMAWRAIFGGDESKISEFCTTMIMNQLPDGTPAKNVNYYLLCDVSSRDYEIRRKLQDEQLEIVLFYHEFERKDDKFEKHCLFCREIIRSTRCDFIEHLFNKHFLKLGKPENLVFIDELINMLQMKLSDLICIFCEKKFRDRTTLKEHMRKKGHKRINPDNKSYDKFFLMNYQCHKSLKTKYNGSSQRNIQSAEKKSQNDENIFDNDSNWSDWEDEMQEIICLFCPQKSNDIIKLKNHMNEEHGIDFDQETDNTTFYDRVKIVNYVRRKIYTLQCIICSEQFENGVHLQNHLKKSHHYSLGLRKDWDLPEYFFPTYEDDTFLCYLEDFSLEDDVDFSNSSPSITIFTEESNISLNLDAEALSKEKLDILETVTN